MKIQIDEYKYVVPKVLVKTLSVKFQKLNLRREKLIKLNRLDENFPEIKFNIKEVNDEIFNRILSLDEYSCEYKNLLEQNLKYYVRVNLNESIPPSLNGWKILGLLEKNPETLICKVTSFCNREPVPYHFTNTHPNQCDHCDINKNRNLTFVLKNIETDELIQIGHTCMTNYISKDELEMLMFFTSAKLSLDEYDPDSILGGNPVFLLSKKNYLAVVNSFIRKFNEFIPLKKSDPFRLYPSTLMAALHKIDNFYLKDFLRSRLDGIDDISRNYLEDYKTMIEKNPILQEDLDVASNTIEWFRNNPPAENESEIYKKIYHLIIKEDQFLFRGESRIVGYAIEFINQYNLEIEKKNKYLQRKENALEVPIFLADEKEKFEKLEVNLVGLDKINSDNYGDSAVYYLETRDGRKLKWKASNMGRPDCFSNNDEYPSFESIKNKLYDIKKSGKEIWFLIKGSVTRHSEYTSKRGEFIQQTDIGRVNSQSEIYFSPKTDGIIHFGKKYELMELKLDSILKGLSITKEEPHYCYNFISNEGQVLSLYTFNEIDSLKEGEYFRLPAQKNGHELVGVFKDSIEKIEGFTPNPDVILLTRLKASKYGQKKK